MSQLPALSPTLRDRATAALAPFFVNGADGDTVLARAAAAAVLDDYHAMTPKELQLSAQSVAFGFAALACLSAAAMVQDRDVDIMLDLQDSAIALNTLAQKSTKALHASRRERERAPHLMSAEHAVGQCRVPDRHRPGIGEAALRQRQNAGDVSGQAGRLGRSGQAGEAADPVRRTDDPVGSLAQGRAGGQQNRRPGSQADPAIAGGQLLPIRIPTPNTSAPPNAT